MVKDSWVQFHPDSWRRPWVPSGWMANLLDCDCERRPQAGNPPVGKRAGRGATVARLRPAQSLSLSRVMFRQQSVARTWRIEGSGNTGDQRLPRASQALGSSFILPDRTNPRRRVVPSICALCICATVQLCAHNRVPRLHDAQPMPVKVITTPPQPSEPSCQVHLITLSWNEPV
jgi:hypothetical protein